MQNNNDANIVEAALFMAGKPLSVDEIKRITGLKKDAVLSALQELERRYENTSLVVRHLGNDVYEMHVREQYLKHVEKLAPEKDFSPGTLKTLALIAYKSPVKQSDVVKVRGNRAYEQIEELVKRGFVTVKPKGHTKELRVTKTLLKYFGLKSEAELKKYFEKLKIREEDLEEKEEKSEAQEKSDERKNKKDEA